MPDETIPFGKFRFSFANPDLSGVQMSKWISLMDVEF
jgi:hypothetical protein